ncbi:ScbA/BarX family gamma-butyrolactone biosynthesis protein [Streptomyces sp. NPDC097619]|uniref:ScbA/BarX family gamma-butyrolactone biosynthesis protein n=1 Tax=Streptomyces sp. NPDC097619 TaxID=3157228 RepID=UPI003328B66B
MLVSTDRPAPDTTALTSTVAKEYVHRAALADVFLTGWSQNGADAFTIEAQWPRYHGFYASEHGLYDPLLLCETVRQTLPLLTHTAFGVPFGHQLSWSHFHYAVHTPAMRVERTPAELKLHVSVTDITYRRGLPVSLDLHYEIMRGDLLLAVAGTRFHCHTPALYQRLRAGKGNPGQIFWNVPEPAPPLTKELCGRDRPQDVVLSPAGPGRHWRLRVDTAHPVLFDHPVDHVPGMLLLEAARQAAHACAAPGEPSWPAAMDISFHRYVEFDAPCWITADPTGTAEGLQVTARQGDHDTPAFTSTITLTAP